MSELETSLKVAFQPTETRQMMVSRVYKKGRILVSEDFEEETISVRVPPEDVPQAHVTYGGKFTKNLGDFNSVSIDVRLTLPTAVEEIDDAYDAAKAFVEAKSQAEFEAVKKNFPSAFKGK